MLCSLCGSGSYRCCGCFYWWPFCLFSSCVFSVYSALRAGDREVHRLYAKLVFGLHSFGPRLLALRLLPAAWACRERLLPVWSRQARLKLPGWLAGWKAKLNHMRCNFYEFQTSFSSVGVLQFLLDSLDMAFCESVAQLNLVCCSFRILCTFRALHD